MRRALSLVALWTGSLVGFASPQQPVTRADAVAAALARGARAAFGRADTAAAAAVLHGARLYPNPALAATYTKDVPHYHVVADLPLDLPWLRSARIGAAASARDAARYGFAFGRAAIRFDVDTTYTRALAALAHARLSRRTASDADSLLAVQLAMGLPAETPTITLADSLVPPPPPLDSAPAPATEPLRVAAAAASLRSSERALTLAHRSVLPAPSLQAGFDQGDPTGPSGLLPIIGVSLSLPLFNRNGGEIAQATAARDRAQANFDLVGRESAAERSRAERGFTAAMARLERNRRLLASADRVAAMSLQAYAEGAVPLANVLEAQRNAREALGRYIDDVAAANDAAASLRLLTGAEEP